jgi:hypothetical protein
MCVTLSASQLSITRTMSVDAASSAYEWTGPVVVLQPLLHCCSLLSVPAGKRMPNAPLCRPALHRAHTPAERVYQAPPPKMELLCSPLQKGSIHTYSAPPHQANGAEALTMAKCFTGSRCGSLA